jgi:hypothetical protein
MPPETPLVAFTQLVVYTLTSLVEQTTPAYHVIFDAYASVSDITFIDKDMDPERLGGMVRWTPPAATAPDRVVVYKVYLSTSPVGAERLQVIDDVDLGTEVRSNLVLGSGPDRVQVHEDTIVTAADRPRMVDDVVMGANQLLMPPEMPLVAFTQLVVYTQSSLVEQTTPVSFRLLDKYAMVGNITFPDQDLDFDDIGGLVSWTAPDDTSEVTHYIMYLSMDVYGTNRSYLDNASVGIDNITVPVDTTISPFTHLRLHFDVARGADDSCIPCDLRRIRECLRHNVHR